MNLHWPASFHVWWCHRNSLSRVFIHSRLPLANDQAGALSVKRVHDPFPGCCLFSPIHLRRRLREIAASLGICSYISDFSSLFFPPYLHLRIVTCRWHSYDWDTWRFAVRRRSCVMMQSFYPAPLVTLSLLKLTSPSEQGVPFSSLRSVERFVLCPLFEQQTRCRSGVQFFPEYVRVRGYRLPPLFPVHVASTGVFPL